MPISPEDLVMFESDWPGGGWNRDEGIRLPGPRRSGELGAHIPDAVRKLAGEPGAPKGLAELGVTEDTIKAHLRSIFSKLEVADRTQAVTTALRRGIITL